MLYCAYTCDYVIFSGFSQASRNFLANFREGARKSLNRAENRGGLGIIRDDSGSIRKVLKTERSFIATRGFNSLHLRQQKTHFFLPTKVRFLNDVCLRQMMLACANDVRYANDVCLTAHWGKHRIIAERSEATSFCAKRKTSYRRRRCIIKDTRLMP